MAARRRGSRWGVREAAPAYPHSEVSHRERRAPDLPAPPSRLGVLGQLGQRHEARRCYSPGISSCNSALFGTALTTHPASHVGSTRQSGPLRSPAAETENPGHRHGHIRAQDSAKHNRFGPTSTGIGATWACSFHLPATLSSPKPYSRPACGGGGRNPICRWAPMDSRD